MKNEYLSEIGAKGGSATTARKAAASRRNGARPCAPGKRRGRVPKPKPTT